ncbi:MAG: DNA polymerase III subunit gamma/tau [Puniceicoccales bacterium]|jgi:DNA polymerase-3 subunit gamma/tau|nr:DNA polymerase III subunit gamma/tau [Puniceicoccales bacterium]
MPESEYQVIARRWRPRRFSELVGQEPIVKTLAQAIERRRIAHAFLFIGPRGTGKTSTARLLAAALNAQPEPSLQADPDLPLTRSILEGNCLDVIEIDGASNNSVEQIRALREECRYAPSECRYKIYILDEIHMLSLSAFNALLKTLEEPPAHVKFLFATTEAAKIPVTIASRCQRFEFRLLPPALIAQKLQQIAEQENVRVEVSALEVLARLAAGSLRDAQTYLEQLMNFGDGTISRQAVLKIYGLATPEELEEILQAIYAEDYRKILHWTDLLEARGCDFPRLLLDLRDRVQSQLLESPSAQSSPEKPSAPLLAKVWERLSSSHEELRSGLSEKVNFEMALFRAIAACQMRNLDELLRRLRALPGADPGENVPPSSLPAEETFTPPAEEVPPPMEKTFPSVEEGPPPTEEAPSPESHSANPAGGSPSPEQPSPEAEERAFQETGKNLPPSGKANPATETSPPDPELLAKLPASTHRKLVERFGLQLDP